MRSVCSNPAKYSDLVLALSLSAAIVFVPQVNFYDLGVSACVALYLFRPDSKADWSFWGFSAALSQLAVNPPFGAPIHFILAIGALFYIASRVRDEIISYSA